MVNMAARLFFNPKNWITLRIDDLGGRSDLILFIYPSILGLDPGIILLQWGIIIPPSHQKFTEKSYCIL